MAFGLLLAPRAPASSVTPDPVVAADWIAEIARWKEVSADRLLEVLVPRGADGVHDLLNAGPPHVDRDARQEVELALTRIPELVQARKQESSTSGSWKTEAAVALAIFGALGGPSGLGVAIDVASPTSDDNPREILTAFEFALTDVLRRDRGTFGPVQRQIHGAHPSLQACMVRAVGSTSGTDALGVLVQLLGGDPRLDLVLLNQIRRVAASADVRAGDGARSVVRVYLQSREPGLRREAAAALGSLHDFDSIEPLIELLEDPSTGVRENAHWALRELTGVFYRNDVRRWRAWYRDETKWWEQYSPSVLRKLHHPRDTVIAAAINELASHRLYRNEISAQLLPLLQHRDVNIVRMTCAALTTFRSHTGVPELVELLDSRNVRVRDAAWSALKTITGQDLPQDAARWRDWLS